MAKWDGKTKGTVLGYRFFIYCVRFLGLNISYFFCRFVSLYFFLFQAKARNGLVQFYQLGLGYSKSKALWTSIKTFYHFGQTLIDRFAVKTHRAESFTYQFENEQALVELSQNQQPAILLSAHVGNWENAGFLLRKRITNKINVLVLDAELEKIKSLVEETGGYGYQFIPIKNDLSHLIDRYMDNTKTITHDFLGHPAKFPIGVFELACKLKVPVTFVYAIKQTDTHYGLSATTPMLPQSANELFFAYLRTLESKVKANPTQWFNFYQFYDDI
jgi:predicted LPLAT superfamily acyltransferase